MDQHRGCLSSPLSRPPSVGQRVVPLALALVLLVPSGAAAQSELGSARSDGLAGAFLGLAGGAYAVGRNPASLAFATEPAPDLPAPTWILPSVSIRMGLAPVTLGDLAEYSGRTVPHPVRLDWLGSVADAGGQVGGGRADLTVFAVRRGRFGLRWAAQARAEADLNADAAEVLLFGNSGRTGSPGTFAFDGSRLDAWSMSSVSLDAGATLADLRGSSEGRNLAVGATLSWTFGHALLSASDAGSRIDADPVVLQGVLPVVRSSGEPVTGGGPSLSLSAEWRRDRWTAVVQVKNLLSGFSWSPSDLEYRPGLVILGPDRSDTSNPIFPLGEAPASVRERIERFHLGRGMTVAGTRVVSAEARAALQAACTWSGPFTPGARCSGAVGIERGWHRRYRASAGAQLASGRVGLGLGGSLRVARVLVDVALLRGLGDAPETRWALGAALLPGS